MWPIEPRFFSAEYSGLIAAPGNAEGDGHAFLFQDPYGRIDRSHLRHVAPRCLLGMMITATTDDLNEAEFVSRDVE